VNGEQLGLHALEAVQFENEHGADLVSCHRAVLAGEIIGDVPHERPVFTRFNFLFHGANVGNDSLFNRQGFATGG
jgi:hypothetical protein